MNVTLSEALAVCLNGQADVDIPDDMLELLTTMVVDDGSAAVSELLLHHKELPLRLAQKLVDRRGVSAAELAAFASREDMPSEMLQEWVRKERRVTVLAQIAAKPDLPQEVFEVLATRNGTALRDALLSNESAPEEVRAAIAADLLTTASPHASLHQLHHALASSGPLQRAVFARLSPDELQRHVAPASGWDGLTMHQLHSLLDAVERHAAAIPAVHVDATWRNRRKVDNAYNMARTATNQLAEHPSADTGLLDRLEKFADANSACCSRTMDDAVAVARQRLALLGDYCEQLHAAPHSKLVELADSGVLCAATTAQQAVRNPLFDTDIAVRILEAANRLARRDYSTEHLLLNWASDLASALRVYRAMHDQPPYTLSLAKHVAAASTGELLEAVNSVADSPEWGWSLAETFATNAADGAVTDDVVGRFGWFPDHVAAAGTRCRSGALTVDYLYRRFGAHPPTWRMFGSIADPSTPLADAAALAIHAEPPPTPLQQTTPEPEPPAREALCEQVSLF